MFQALLVSFTDYDLLRPPRFVGLANFVDLVHDSLFLNAARVSLTYVVFSCVPVWLLSLALAVLFNRWIIAKNLFRSAAFMPVVMPAVVNAVVWTFMYHQDGVVNTLLGFVGLSPIPWLRSSATALWAVILIGIWRATPYYMVIFLAGLQAIPEEYYEAAQIDGATGWAAFRHITLPLLMPTTLLVVVMSVIVALKVFAVPLIMTGGGPADATRVLPLLIYQTAFEFFKMGRAAAMSMFLFLAVMIFSIVQIRLFSRGEDS
jgi:ABC-type sugar transport system permease subunit